MPRWSKWISIDENPGYGGPAVYRVRMVLEKRPICIWRIGGMIGKEFCFTEKPKNSENDPAIYGV
jgi:hypothetical protein